MFLESVFETSLIFSDKSVVANQPYWHWQMTCKCGDCFIIVCVIQCSGWFSPGPPKINLFGSAMPSCYLLWSGDKISIPLEIRSLTSSFSNEIKLERMRTICVQSN